MIVDYWHVPGVLYTRYLGVVSGPELVQSSLAASGDERFDNIRLIIGDWSEVKKTLIEAEHVKELVACLGAVSRICPDAVNASIVRRNETGLALAAWYRHLATVLPWEIDIFHSAEEAGAFYGISAPQLTEKPGETRQYSLYTRCAN